MVDPRRSFIARVDLSKTRVRAFEGFVLLCGGSTASDPVPFKSVRHMIYHELTSGRHGDMATRLKVAEEIQDWFRDGNYRDLLTFEEHLAGLSAVIVLVVESPGAMAELGAFSMAETFLERLLVLIANVHYEEDSFIRLGPIKRVEEREAKHVLVYDWHEIDYRGSPRERLENIEGEMAEIAEAIREFTSPSKSERVFKATEPAHVMLLVCELCALFGALNRTEIGDYLRALNVNIEGEEIDRFLFLLHKCDLLAIKAYGHGRYYYPLEWRSRVSWGFSPGERIILDRLRVDVAEYYEREISSRHEVLRRIGSAAQ